MYQRLFRTVFILLSLLLMTGHAQSCGRNPQIRFEG